MKNLDTLEILLLCLTAIVIVAMLVGYDANVGCMSVTDNKVQTP